MSRPGTTLLLAVAAGGALGAVLRWLASDLAPDGSGFPWTTFAINVIGSVSLALLPLVVRRRLTAAALGPGLLGGWTTLSASSEQTRGLLADGHTGLAGAYLLGTLAACLVGVAVVSRLAPPPTPEERE